MNKIYLKQIAIYMENYDLHSSKEFYYEKKKFHSIVDKNIQSLLNGLKENPDFVLKIKTDDHCGKQFLWLCFQLPINNNEDYLNQEIMYKISYKCIDRSKRLELLLFAFDNLDNEFLNIQNENYYNEDDNTYDDGIKKDFCQFSNVILYKLLRKEHENDICDRNIIDNDIQFNSLLNVKLRPYQEKGILWLMKRELLLIKLLHYNYIQLKVCSKLSNQVLYLNRRTLEITNNGPEFYDLPTGGILADEMGLGKTVEILTLILLNRRKLLNVQNENKNQEQNDEIDDMVLSKRQKLSSTTIYCICGKNYKSNTIICSQCLKSQHRKCVSKYIKHQNDNYKCPKCWSSSTDLIKSAATIIVSPQTISDQWITEIKKHSKIPLNVFRYDGVLKGWISPEDLSSYDVIVTDYNALKKELYFCNDESRDLRSPKKYMKIKSPLLLIDWWRVCLDEAQMVESATSLAAQMVKLLPAVHRWAVTGTPIQKSIDDLKGLLDFIGAYPFFEKRIWNDILNFYKTYKDVTPLVRILGKLMWRTCKINVLDEIGIPPQSELMHYITMSDVEILYYRGEHRLCSEIFEEKVKKYAASSNSLSHLDAKTIKVILTPLLKLRQICTMPMVLYKTQQNTIKRYLQPQELIDHLKSTNELDCKAQLRAMASCYNGMAALEILQEKYEKAIKNYKNVLSLSKQYNDAICVDSLLQIHALHNLMYVKKCLIKNDTDDLSEYESERIRLEWKYLQSYYENLKKVEENVDIIRNQVQNNQKYKFTDVNDKACNWWRVILNQIYNFGYTEQLLSKMNDEMEVHTTTFERLTTIHGVDLLFTLWAHKIFSHRKQILIDFKKFDDFTNNIKPIDQLPHNTQIKMSNFIKTVFDCHLSDIRNDTQKNEKTEKEKKTLLCDLCKTKENLTNYERVIFKKFMDKDEESTEVTRNPSLQETLMKILVTFAKNKFIELEEVKIGEEFLQFIDSLKKEHKENSKLWIEIEYTVKAYDELDMCKMRIQVSNEIDLEKNDKKKIYQILNNEIQGTYLQNECNLRIAQEEFTAKLGRLKYICHLKNKNGPGICPICKHDPDTKYSMLECGHHLCMVCLKGMALYQKRILICAICRHEQKYEDVYLVTIKKPNEMYINGEYSSKIEEIIRIVIKLKEDDKDIKIIIFSQWAQILDAIAFAFKNNDITYKLNATSKNISEFKDEKLGITCFLLPLSQGAKGLNLIEATHVFLVEPILNPGEELQAINRVHRIGQTKPTTVHRFIVKETIDETIYNTIVNDKTNIWQTNHLNVDRIRNLFAYNF